jgi:membrane-associated phospholipid phosphatase
MFNILRTVHSESRRGLILLSLLSLLSLLALCGCAAVPGQAPWGSRVDYAPDWGKLGAAAVESLQDPLTWGPAAGALIFSLGDLDREVSDWARDEQPLFGGEADQAGDWLLGGISGLYLGSALLTESGTGKEWSRNKVRGLGLGLSADLTAIGLAYGLKKTTGRTRPDRSDQESFPSGHSSLAAVHAALFSQNLDTLPLSPPARKLLRGSGYALAWGTAWARIEAGKHYPSDSLAGLALGNWVAMTLQHSLLADSNTRLSLQLDRDEPRVVFQYSF